MPYAQLLQYFRQQNFERLSQSLIEKELMAQQARQRGIRISPEELEAKLWNGVDIALVNSLYSENSIYRSADFLEANGINEIAGFV